MDTFNTNLNISLKERKMGGNIYNLLFIKQLIIKLQRK